MNMFHLSHNVGHRRVGIWLLPIAFLVIAALAVLGLRGKHDHDELDDRDERVTR